ncbi:MAG: hypothetical protein M1820_006397 [Bogoriella megaspora]|nr:MAG: hypothetical protein M1820_006397 [Bogoriella megaspora]
MRGKRSKQYRKLMQQYGIHFGFREPYQVLLDAEILATAHRFSMDLSSLLSSALHGKIKPMITHCTLQHIRALPKDISNPLIAQSRASFEIRRCGHHELPDSPLSTSKCTLDCIDPAHEKRAERELGTNKFRYVVGTQDEELRARLRRIPGVPLIYVNRSVLIMEPMSESSKIVEQKEEIGKFRSGLVAKTQGVKRKREEAEGERDENGDIRMVGGDKENDEGWQKVERKKKKGPKGPNPLSVKKPKKRDPRPGNDGRAFHADGATPSSASEPAEKRRRKRKHKSTTLPNDAINGASTAATDT